MHTLKHSLKATRCQVITFRRFAFDDINSIITRFNVCIIKHKKLTKPGVVSKTGRPPQLPVLQRAGLPISWVPSPIRVSLSRGAI